VNDTASRPIKSVTRLPLDSGGGGDLPLDSKRQLSASRPISGLPSSTPAYDWSAAPPPVYVELGAGRGYLSHFMVDAYGPLDLLLVERRAYRLGSIGLGFVFYNLYFSLPRFRFWVLGFRF
jgi:hypothetical protein